MKELKDVAKNNNFKLYTLPTLYEVRFAEFTYNLFKAVLHSWQALVTYFKESKEKEAKGFYNFLTQKNTLLLLTFTTDLLEVFSNFQKNLQGDNITLLDMMDFKEGVCLKIESLKDTPLLGGWVSTLQKEIIFENDTEYLKGHPLIVTKRRTKKHNLYVSEKRDVDSIKNEIILTLAHKIEDRFFQNEEIVDVLRKFIKFDKNTDLLKVHEYIASDLDLPTLDIEFTNCTSLNTKKIFNNKSLTEILKILLSSSKFSTLSIIFSRLLAATPHSCDVERLISSNNILKTFDRSNLTIETEALYLYIYYNMPPLEKWDPNPAILKWLSDRSRRNKECLNAKRQDWYKGIFEEYDKEQESEKQEEDVESIESNKKNEKIRKKNTRCF